MIGAPFNGLNPYWWVPFGGMPFGPFGQSFGLGQGNVFGGRQLRRLDVGGIYELSTNAVQLTDETVDYGIDPCCYALLPCESVVLLKVHAAVPDGGEALPVTIAIPNAGRTTLDASTTAGTATGATKAPVVDSQGTQVVGEDIEATTERLAYINKRTGVIRLLEYTSTAGAGAGA